MLRHRLALGLFIAAGSAAPALANEITFTTASSDVTPWSAAMFIPRFDPALGTLQSMRIELRNSIRGRVGYENLAASSASSQVHLQGTLNLGGPAGFAMSTITSVPVAIQTQAFDGVQDQGGSSGGLLVNLVASHASIAAPNPNQMNAFVGTGALGVQVSASNTTSLAAGDPLSLSSRVHAEAAISVTYTYAPPTAREAGYTRPASLLLYPEFDSTPGSSSIVTLTTSHAGPSSIRARFVYIEGSTCLEFDRTEILTAKDTFSAVVGSHNAFSTRGYLYVYALDELQRPVAHDFFTGSMLRLDGINSFAYNVNALAFRAAPGVTLTDVDGDDLRDLNGLEYEKAPEELLFPRFLGTTATRDSDLILVNLSGGDDFTAVANILLWNDNSEVFSAQHAFSCWTKTPLSSVSGAFTNNFLHNLTNDDPNEIFGATAEESGWFQLDGFASVSPNVTITDPALVGVLIERSGSSSFGAELPFYVGEQVNGDLVIRSPDGDTAGG